MELKKAAEELGISTRHIHRLIEDKTLPAKKKTIVVELRKIVWDVDEKTIMTAKNLLESWKTSEQDFGSWLASWVSEYDLPLSRLAQMSKIKKRTLQRIINNQAVRRLPKDYQMIIISALMREMISRNKAL